MATPSAEHPVTTDAAAQRRVELAPATGIDDPAKADIPSEEEPVVTGTLFLGLLFLMMIFGFWITLYLTLLNR